ncbi:TPA: hypothetical protein ACH3X2_002946 [Trebouxia sp. C0005]
MRRAPPDGGTYEVLTALLTQVGAVGQALQVYELKLQQGLPADGKGLSDIIVSSARAGQWKPALAAWSLLQG